jgi:hypothetical protein
VTGLWLWPISTAINAVAIFALFTVAEAGGARMLVGFAPMQFEGFQREVCEPAPERVLPPPLEGHADVARLAPIARRNGFEFLGPPGPPPGQ